VTSPLPPLLHEQSVEDQDERSEQPQSKNYVCRHIEIVKYGGYMIGKHRLPFAGKYRRIDTSVVFFLLVLEKRTVILSWLPLGGKST